jgi:two-component system nitrate/nitrite response regulator NarL
VDILSRLKTTGDRIVILGHADDLRRLTLDQIVSVDGVISFDTTSAAGLDQSLRLVRVGERVIPRELMTQGALELTAPPRAPSLREGDLPPVSPREADMLRYLVRGASNKVIARELGITEATVKVHLKGVFRKLRVLNRTQAALWAQEHGYDTSGD